MKNRRHILAGIGASIGMIVLILDTKTALSGAIDGITLCISTVIPSLFPFFLFSILLNNTLLGTRPAFLRPLGKVLGIPSGAEPLLLIGLIGGYPVGAQCIADAYRSKILTKSDAHRMLGFCSNAGPAFIFGMGSCIFDRAWVLWALWAIHILSALFVGAILPRKTRSQCSTTGSKSMSIAQVLEISIRTTATVCSWIIIFRVLLAFLNRWFLWLLRDVDKGLFTGLLELSNGCYTLPLIHSKGAQFILCATFLGFGGICVLMQTFSVTAGLGLGMYFPGKAIQCAVSILISGLVQMLLFSPNDRWDGWILYAVIAISFSILSVFFTRTKKRVEILC